MTDLPKSLRAELAESFAPIGNRIVKHLQADDGTHKLLVELRDGKTVDTFLEHPQPRPRLLRGFTHHQDAEAVLPAAPDPAVKATVKPGQTNYQVNKSNPGLSQAISDDLAKLRADGTIKQILTSEGFPAEAAEPGTPGYAD